MYDVSNVEKDGRPDAPPRIESHNHTRRDPCNLPYFFLKANKRLNIWSQRLACELISSSVSGAVDDETDTPPLLSSLLETRLLSSRFRQLIFCGFLAIFITLENKPIARG